MGVVGEYLAVYIDWISYISHTYVINILHTYLETNEAAYKIVTYVT